MNEGKNRQCENPKGENPNGKNPLVKIQKVNRGIEAI